MLCSCGRGVDAPEHVVIAFTMPMHLVSEANTREHWGKKARRAKGQRATACMAFRSYARGQRVELPAVVLLTRIAPRSLDSDNLARAFKAVRDGIADAIGIDDGDDQIGWAYRQERGKPKEHAVMVRVIRAEEGAA